MKQQKAVTTQPGTVAAVEFSDALCGGCQQILVAVVEVVLLGDEQDVAAADAGLRVGAEARRVRALRVVVDEVVVAVPARRLAGQRGCETAASFRPRAVRLHDDGTPD